MAMLDVRQRLASEVRKLVGSGENAAGFVRAPGDTGLVPEGAVAWRVHGDFSTMMIGGVSALLMQMLHPAALAGVWDHSNFRNDMAGRLRRTAQFMAGTTYGTTEYAEALIGRVNRIHAAVAGTLPDGTPYRANDPAVLTWVQVAGAYSFLTAYMRYRDPRLSGAAQDRYYAETAAIAERLGASDIPTTRRGVEAYFRTVRPQLRTDARTREVVAVILASPPPQPAAAPAARLIIEAGIDLLPDWAARMHGLGVAPLRKPLVRAGAQGLGAVLRWALQPGHRDTKALATPSVGT
jgi:uncharacterized protein (DUF2236 family)